MEASRLRVHQRYDRITLYSIFVFAVAMPISISLTQMAIAVAVVSGMMAWYTLPLPRPALSIGLERAFAAFIMAELLAFAFSTNRIESFIFLKRLLLIPVVYVVALHVRNEKMYRTVMHLVVAGLSLYSLLGLYTFVTTSSIRLRHIHNSMTAGGLTMMAVLLCTCLLVHEKNRKRQLLYAAAALVNGIALLLTSTRSAWLGALVGLIIIFLLVDKRYLLSLPVIMAAFYIFTPSGIAYHVRHLFDPLWGTNVERLQMWSTGLKIIRDYPICGIGDVSTQAMFQRYAPPDFTYLIGHFHNNWVHIGVTLGIVGLLAFAYMMSAIFIRLLSTYKAFASSPGLMRGGTLAGLAIFCAFHISGLFEWNFGDAEIITMVWFFTGMTMATRVWSRPA
jgi:O-antigen ligase